MADLMTELCRPDSGFTSMSMRAGGSRTNSESLVSLNRIDTGIVCSFFGCTRFTRWKILVGAVAGGIISSARKNMNILGVEWIQSSAPSFSKMNSLVLSDESMETPSLALSCIIRCMLSFRCRSCSQP